MLSDDNVAANAGRGGPPPRSSVLAHPDMRRSGADAQAPWVAGRFDSWMRQNGRTGWWSAARPAGYPRSQSLYPEPRMRDWLPIGHQRRIGSTRGKTVE